MKMPAWLIWLLALLGIARRGAREEGEAHEQVVEPGDPSPRAELVVIALLLLAALASAAFVVFYGVGFSTQVLGVTLAGALALIAAALIVASRALVVTEEIPETYPLPHPEAQEEVAEVVRQSGTRITRKRLLGAAAGTAAGTLGLAVAAPVVSLGPLFDTDPLRVTPWRKGRRLVDEHGVPLRADDITTETFYSAYPEGASRDEIGSPLVIVRVDPSQLRLPPGRRSWAPEGILAYSKICTHAGCAIALYRKPLFPEAEPKPALVCPCHYSTFDPTTGAQVIFGPAGRPLPQLPLTIDGQRNLRAGGNFSGNVGPAWSGVRSDPPTN
jgi:ubiquinol-cytochrome c reductase iron-sulfur subunit